LAARHQGRDPQHTVAVGWDNPLSTFFAQVSRPVDDEDGPIILWFGADRLVKSSPWRIWPGASRPFADLSSEMMDRLHADRNAKLDQAPT
jgi:hypothetical protein